MKSTWTMGSLRRKVVGTAFIFLTIIICSETVQAQHSVARRWNEALLHAIRGDFARPTVHARNLFHTSVVMYDAWAAYDETVVRYLLGRTVDGFRCDYSGISAPSDVESAREQAISYAAYRLLNHRFGTSPGADESLLAFDNLMNDLGYDISFTSTDYAGGNPAALGNYIAECMISFGLQDGSNEANDYVNQHYEPVNEPLPPIVPGNASLSDPNRWQPLALDVFIDQSGIEIGEFPDFLSPEWGVVSPFSLSSDDLTINERDGNEYWVYHDPGNPPYMNWEGPGDTEDAYKWGFELVSVWSSQLDPADNVMWDISPASIGNVGEFPSTFEEYKNFYNLTEGGDPSVGHTTNPHTSQPYAPNMVPRGDYGRVLAEFWADGPDSETPPGHWFTLLNYVSDHELLEKKFKGEGDVLNDLEWDIKAYFIMGGTMHDAAISAWGIKGWYDYLRPISALRAMAGKGQSSDPNLANYHEDGITLIDGYIELVESGDPLAGSEDQNVGRIKVNSWKGPDYIEEPETDVAGVGWILASRWWPYQRPSFVTPPFAGYVSGHSTYSRAAAEVMTLLTGDAFFPGGMGEFQAPKNEFLVFEDGPSVDVTLQWATYRDASDQCSLSRIWGGIHPPVDDIPGRKIGEKIGIKAFEFAENYFNGVLTSVEEPIVPDASFSIYPNPANGNIFRIQLHGNIKPEKIELLDMEGRLILTQILDKTMQVDLTSANLSEGLYLVKAIGSFGVITERLSIVK